MSNDNDNPSEPSVKWRGRFIEWLTDDTWRFHTCLRCEMPLKTPTTEGYGPECRRRRPLDWRAQVRNARAEDRARYQRERAIPKRRSR